MPLSWITFSVTVERPLCLSIHMRALSIPPQKTGDFDFFRFVLDGHRRLWLPRATGSSIVGYSVLVFLITLITGILLWIPKKWNKKSIKQRITISSPPHNLSHLNLSLHRVLGVYALIPLVVLCFTGLIFSLGWFSKAAMRQHREATS